MVTSESVRERNGRVQSNQVYDAVIIGAGVIGCATAFELAERGLITLNVDLLPTSGYVSTSSSCTAIRLHYSTLDGSAFTYDVTEDWLPIYGRSAVDDFYMACGTSGNQSKNAPVVGWLMSALIDYCESGNNHDQIPLQFALGNVDHVLDTSTMSHLREINPESSFSVLG